jgi:flagellar hook-basal body complex protein FliE
MPMNVSSVSSAAAAVPTQSVGTREERLAAPAGSGAGAFARVLTQFLNDAGSQQAHAETSVKNLAAGRADNVHNVMLAMAKADLSFHLVLEIRNRLSDAYQEIMRMQV